MSLISDPVDWTSRSEAKIALFRSLFRGRDDVYPRRFESRKSGRGGYAPACANEWVRGICEKPRIKCAECPHRRFLPVPLVPQPGVHAAGGIREPDRPTVAETRTRAREQRIPRRAADSVDRPVGFPCERAPGQSITGGDHSPRGGATGPRP